MSEKLHCVSCFKELQDDHFKRKPNHDNEHCPYCGNDFLGSRWYNRTMTKEKIEKLKAVLAEL